MLKPTCISEAALYVGDLDRAVAFYTGLFGCPVLRRDDHFCALRIADEQVLLLFVRGGSLQAHEVEGGVIPAHDGSGQLHLCFGIHGDELETWKEKLEEKGIPIESRVKWPSGAASIYFRDPDQNAIELATPGIWD